MTTALSENLSTLAPSESEVDDAAAERPGAFTVAADDPRCTVNVLTGFLGSGKTTLLRRLLNSDAFARCAVLVNELGEIALDHELLERIDQETVVLRSGCICCGVRSDMAAALLDLTARRDRGEVPPFDRVVIETTGLADPVPVINTVISDATLRHHYRVGTLVSTVDAVLGRGQLRQRPESRKQVAVADRIVITKADLASPEELLELRKTLRSINSHCRLVESRNDASEAEVRMAADLAGSHRAGEVAEWFSPQPGAVADHASSLFASGGRRLAPIHGSIDTIALTFDEPLDWTAFGVWLSMLLHRHGDTILRVKGILNLCGLDVPTVVHGVQHLLHPPVHLSGWPDGDRRSRLVLIGELPEAEMLQRSLESFNRLVQD